MTAHLDDLSLAYARRAFQEEEIRGSGFGDMLGLVSGLSPDAAGVPLEPIVRELLGRADGLDGGAAGHMHLLSRKHRAATSGIVAVVLTTAGMVVTLALEVPTTWRVARGAPIPTGPAVVRSEE